MEFNDNPHILDQNINKATIRWALNVLSILTLTGMGILSLLQFREGNITDARILSAAIIPILTALGFIQKERFELAGGLIGISLVAVVTILATLGQGVYDIGTMAYPAILIIASLILKRNTVIYLTGIIIISIGWLVFGAMNGLYQPDYPAETFARQFIINSIILIITMVAVYILSNTVRTSLAAAQNELRERKRVEQALRETETMYRALVEQTSVVIYRDAPTLEGSTEYISPQIEDILGYSTSEWKDNPAIWKDLTHPEDLPHVMSEIENYLANGGKSAIEYRMRAKDGRWIWFQDESVVIRDDNGEPIYVHGVLIDITTRKNAEQKIQQRESILNAVAKTAQLLLKTRDWRKDINSILKLLGEATSASHVYLFENHPGIDEVMLSSQKYEWVRPGMKPELNNPVYQNTRLVPVPGIEDWHTNLSAGRPFYGSGRQYPRYWKRVFDPRGVKTLLDVPVMVNGDWWGIIGFDDFVNEMPWSQVEVDALVAAAGFLGTSIERQNTDEGLRASEEKFHLAFHHTAVAMAISRRTDNTLLDVNESFCKVTGYTKEEAIGKRAGRDLNIWVNQEDRNTILAMLQRKGYVDEYKANFRRKNGEVGVGLLSAVAVSIAGEPCQLDSFVDISSIEELLNELRVKNDELQSFTYTVSHDLKAPLVTISGFMGYLEQDARNGDLDKLDKDVLRISEAISKMQQLLNELLELSRIGRLMNPPENVPFGEIVDEALSLVEGVLKEAQVQVEVEADLPSVYGDRARLVEVLQNLIDNAAKFMKNQKYPKIEIGVDKTSVGRMFFVRDNGAGIEPEHFERIFGLFNKLDSVTDGTGIGLALVKRIVEVHGGRIWVESQGLNRGATFYFTLAEPSNRRVEHEK